MAGPIICHLLYMVFLSTASNGIKSRSALTAYQQNPSLRTRNFHSTSVVQAKDFFPEPDTPHIKKTKTAWPHPIYTVEQMNQVAVAHRDTRNWSDKVALIAVKLLRWGLDTVSGYKHGKAQALHAQDPQEAQKRYGMTGKQYLVRNVFLESVAGVPGMVAGMLRHLHSMRRMKRDHGWIETLLEESYNERMHLLIFLKLYEPGWFMRLAVLGAQGVFFNAMFLSYLISPRTCHRFVGYLEEEAVVTYTRELADLEAGKLPEWETLAAPDIAVDYYNLPEGHRTMKDLLLHVRADEAKHREVNHTLGNLDQNSDPNPYASKYDNPDVPHPRKDIKYLKPSGWEREEVM
ncbi:Alternative oxidase, mitochondrial precursor [Venturia inaequalis]|uniref:Alternative oxidase n=1 Tax=Venturia inaequalis TaxID=5025 RepID=A0A8H3U8N5_VENIN|nr:Alternative oxidase, mitochondrial precursor [Venturia inaequalis]